MIKSFGRLTLGKCAVATNSRVCKPKNQSFRKAKMRMKTLHCGRPAPAPGLIRSRILGAILSLVTAGLVPSLAEARFEPLAELDAVSVATAPDFLVYAGRSLQQTWILLNFKQEQRLDVASPEPLGAKASLAYRSRMDYVQVDCKRNLYTELATQMFPEAEGKGSPVYESTFHRSGLPRFATPESHEGKVLAFLCRGVRPPAN